MTEPINLDRLSFSGQVLQSLKVLGKEAMRRGGGPRFIAALKEIHRLLALYAQFGEPYLDLKAERGQLYKGIVRPLAMKYVVHEDRRLVVVGAMPELLPMARPEKVHRPPAVDTLS